MCPFALWQSSLGWSLSGPMVSRSVTDLGGTCCHSYLYIQWFNPRAPWLDFRSIFFHLLTWAVCLTSERTPRWVWWVQVGSGLSALFSWSKWQFLVVAGLGSQILLPLGKETAWQCARWPNPPSFMMTYHYHPRSAWVSDMPVCSGTSSIWVRERTHTDGWTKFLHLWGGLHDAL